MNDAAQHYTDMAMQALGLEAIEILKRLRNVQGAWPTGTWAAMISLLTRIDQLTNSPALGDSPSPVAGGCGEPKEAT